MDSSLQERWIISDRQHLAECSVRPFNTKRNCSIHFDGGEDVEMSAVYHSISSTLKLYGKSVWNFFGEHFACEVLGLDATRNTCGIEQIKINKQYGKTTETNVTRREHTVVRPKLTINVRIHHAGKAWILVV